MLPLSQSQLTLLDTCARKYQHVFFDALSVPSTYEQHTKAQWGSRFHRLMQQQALELPVDVLSAADAEMAASLSALLSALGQAAPKAFAHSPFSQSEHRRTHEFNGYLLTVIYDLVIIAAGKGQIFDWKTYHQPQQKAWLEKDWQTRLYPYVLCETSDLSPEDISMTYWFVRSDGARADESEADGAEADGAEDVKKPSSYTFEYSVARHERTRKDLQRLTDELTRMREQMFFPKVEEAKGLCDRCPFDVRCDRATSVLVPTQTATASDLTTVYTDPNRLLKAAQQLTVDTVEELPL